jgi:hypothetical protein
MLNITVTTEVSGLMLEPGEYEVRQVKSANGPAIRFIRYTYNPYTQEGVSAHQWDVVGEVRVAVQSQDFKAPANAVVDRITQRQASRPADSRQQFSIFVRHGVAAASGYGTRIVRVPQPPPFILDLSGYANLSGL